MVDGYEKLKTSKRAQKTYLPNPKAEIKRGGGPNDSYIISTDGAAAYQLALMWKMTNDKDYADASIRIMNEWAKICKSITGSEAILVAGFTGYQYANAAEIMRDYEGWNKDDFEKFKQWLVDVIYPICYTFLADHNGATADQAWMSWDLPAMVTILAIGILCDDSDKVNIALNYFIMVREPAVSRIRWLPDIRILMEMWRLLHKVRKWDVTKGTLP
ncbi:hypothetical protein KUBF_15440 [Bacteroides finegoldii]|nr:hypothetical protein KUBF_15440 [Bacteroides finegoldii]